MIFAIAACPDDEFDLDEFHTVVWNLQGLFGRQRLFVDFLVILTANAEVRKFDIVVPFSAARSGWLDLAEAPCSSDLTTPGYLKAPNSSEGPNSPIALRSTAAEGPDVIVSAVENFEVPDYRLPSADDAGLLVRRSEHWTCIQVHLSQTIAKGETRAVRVRCDVQGRTSSVYWKVSGLGKNGGLFDLRVFDPEEEVHITRSSVLQRTIRADTASIAAVIRATWKVQFHQPQTMDPMLLERGRFNEYLKRPPDLRNQGALVAYRVSGEGRNGEELGGMTGPRLFLNVAREFGLLPIGNFIRIAITVLIALLLAESVQSASWELINWVIASAVALGAGLLFGLSARVTKIANFYRAVRDRYNQFENWFFRRLES